jgi:phosphate transport system substrate-binding protein
MKPWSAGLFGLLLVLVANGCAIRSPRMAAPSADTIRLKGSDTVLILARRWSEEFMRAFPGTVVIAEGGGTRAGVEALIAGECEFCTASRNLTPSEIERLAKRTGYLGISILCAKDALSIYVNSGNPVRDLTLAQVRDLFTGRIRSWDAVGGEPTPIHVLVREPNSGTRAFLQEHVLQGDTFAAAARTIAGTSALADSVAADPQAIGFGGVAYGANVTHCRIEGASASPGDVRAGTYPLSRYLYLYTVDSPRGMAKRFVDYVLSPEGQRIVREVGYIPLWEFR